MTRKKILAIWLAIAVFLMGGGSALSAYAEESESPPAVEQPAQAPAPEPVKAPDPTKAPEPAPAPEPAQASESERPSEEGQAPVQADDSPQAPADEPCEAAPELPGQAAGEGDVGIIPADEPAQPSDDTGEAAGDAVAESPEEEGGAPAEAPVQLVSLSGLAADRGSISLGETVRWTFEVSGADSVIWHAVRSDGANAASGSADGGSFSWTPSVSGVYTVVVTAVNGGESRSVSGTVTVRDGALRAAVGTAQRYAFANRDAVSFDIAVSGGARPYDVRVQILENGREVYASDKFESPVSYIPRAFGKVALRVTVTDASGSTAAGEASIPVPVDERETEAQWRRSIPGFRDGMTFAERLVAVAKSQLGYRESTRNFIIDEDGRADGYTRYGEWYGMEYEEWCAMFVSFCIEYAGIPKKALPREANNQRWKIALRERYIDDEDEYAPVPGDIVYFHHAGRGDSNDPNFPNHVGIVTRVTDQRIYTIEGNSNKVVREKDYPLDEETIVGYISMRDVMRRYDENYVPQDLVTVRAGRYVTAVVRGLPVLDGKIKVKDGRVEFQLVPDAGWEVTDVAVEDDLELTVEGDTYIIEGIDRDGAVVRVSAAIVPQASAEPAPVEPAPVKPESVKPESDEPEAEPQEEAAPAAQGPPRVRTFARQRAGVNP